MRRLAEVVHLMERQNIKRIPVVEANKIVGIVTRANLLDAMASFVSSTEDAAIREQLLAVLETQSWTSAIDVAVRNDVVQLSGIVTDERQRQALRVTAETSQPSRSQTTNEPSDRLQISRVTHSAGQGERTFVEQVPYAVGQLDYCTRLARRRTNSASLIDPAFFSRSSFSISSAALKPTTRRSSSRASLAR